MDARRAGSHHLAEVLERVVTIGAIRYGPVIGEAALFNGDEPVSASERPNWNLVGDSWSARLTLVPVAGAELSGSIAHVESPEVRLGRGPDARKESVVARFSRLSPSSWRYFLGEWARTDERDRGAIATVLSSWLAEGACCRSDITAAARIEQTDRPEEERTLDPFRTPRPPADLSNLGVSRWTTVTLNLSSARVTWGFVSGGPVRRSGGYHRGAWHATRIIRRRASLRHFQLVDGFGGIPDSCGNVPRSHGAVWCRFARCRSYSGWSSCA